MKNSANQQQKKWQPTAAIFEKRQGSGTADAARTAAAATAG
jgi:hypothetical protein